jgi:hemerythrin
MELKLGWDQIYRTGIEQIDAQHRYFIELIEKMHRLPAARVDDEAGRGLLSELLLYAEFHFRSEENLLRERGYPGLAPHLAEHARLLEELRARARDLVQSPADKAKLVMFLLHWFLDHTSIRDRDYAEYILAHPA